MTHFDDRDAVAAYHANLRANVPGLAVLHELTGELLAEAVPDGGRVLVVGAGGGAELLHLVTQQPTWTFDGVDPSEPMLALARETLGERAGAVTLHAGYVDDAPAGPFDAATCLLTLHFLSRDERAHALDQIRRRLRPGSPLVVFHHSVPDDAREVWFTRAARHAAGPDAAARGTAMAARLPALSPAEDERLLTDAGFAGVGQFYAALSLRGWVAYAG